MSDSVKYISNEVKTIQVRLVCCDKDMECYSAYMSSPIKYPYKCSVCGKTEVTLEQYPLIKYEPIG